MAYEGHIAGVGDRPLGKPLHGALIRRMQRASAAEIAERRAAVVEAVSAVTPLGLVNGGGTGSLHTTSLGGRGDRAHGGLGLLRPDPVRPLLGLRAAPGRDVRPPRGPPPRARGGHPSRRRLPRLGRRRARPPARALPARGPLPRSRSRAPARSRPRSRATRRPACAWGTTSTCATPRRASCSSASTRCTSCRGIASSTRFQATVGRGSVSCDAHVSATVCSTQCCLQTSSFAPCSDPLPQPQPQSPPYCWR